jgi:flagellar biosynthesis chaperone FliJ
VPSRRLEDRIRDLCAQAIAPNTTNFTDTLAELRSALHQHVEQLRKLARQQLALAKRVAQTPTDGETAMRVNGDKQQRIMELVAEIEAEKDQTRFSALVHELNELLEGKPHNLTIPRQSAPLEKPGTRLTT